MGTDNPVLNGAISVDELRRTDRFSKLNTNEGRGGGKLRALTQGGETNKLVFPADLADTDHWVCFRVANVRKFRAKAISQKDNLAYIYLPVPAQLKTGYNASYGRKDLGIGGATLEGLGIVPGTEGSERSFDAKAVAGALGMDIATAESSGLISAAVTSLTGGGTVSAIGAGFVGEAVGQAATAGFAAAGLARNPHTALLFQGTDFRTHSFSYKFIPRSRAESESLNNIITAFKYYMAPQLLESSHFFRYPEQFDIDFKNERSLFDIGTSVLTQFDVDYHGEGRPLYFEKPDNSNNMDPVSVSINMTFQEVTITTKDEIKDFGR